MPKKQRTHGVDSHNLVLCRRAFTINKSQRLGVTQCTSPGSVTLSPGDSGPPVGRVWAGNPRQHRCVTGWLTVSDHPSSHRWCWKEGRGITFSPVGKWGGDSTLQTKNVTQWDEGRPMSSDKPASWNSQCHALGTPGIRSCLVPPRPLSPCACPLDVCVSGMCSDIGYIWYIPMK